MVGIKEYFDALTQMGERNGSVKTCEIFTSDNDTKYHKEITYETCAVWCEISEKVDEESYSTKWRTTFYATDIGRDEEMIFFG